MKLCVVGIGYVGLVTGTCFAEMGNTVYCVDIDAKKIENLQSGIIPIFEPGLTEIIKSCAGKTLFFTTELGKALQNSDIVFIAVGTPSNEDGSADLRHVFSVAEQVGMLMTRDMVVVIKSTVPVGIGDKVKETIQAALDNRGVDYKIAVASNPEFLKEGSAIEDCRRPDRVIVGCEDDHVRDIFTKLYRPFLRQRDRLIFMDIRSAEMTKYAANAMLATRISFMNELSRFCEETGADIEYVRNGISSDTRIGYPFLYAGIGYGGSCFPKDVKALIKTAEEYGLDMGLLKQVDEVNEKQRNVLVTKILKKFGEDLSGRTFAVWGLAFKPNTDDMRAAPSVHIIDELAKRGAKVIAYDPQAAERAQTFYLKDTPNVSYASSKYDALIDADALLLLTEWKEFRSPDFDEIIRRLKHPVIFDGRNQYDPKFMKDLQIEYFGIGRAVV